MRRFPLALSILFLAAGAAHADDYLVGAGTAPGNPNRVRIFDKDCSSTPFDVLAYGAGQWGVNVAAGNINGGAFDEALLAPGPGATLGPQIRGWEPLVGPLGKVNFYAYGTLKYGANVAGADVDDDGFEEILAAPGGGPPFGPHVRGFNFDGGSVAAMPGISFFAYATPRFGATVGGGDIDNRRGDEILTGPGPGPGFGAQVRGWRVNGGAVSALANVNFNVTAGIGGGARATGADDDDDGFDEIVAVAGSQCDVRTFDFDGVAVGSQGVIASFPGMAGCRASRGNVSNLAGDEIVVGAGTGPAGVSTVQGYAWSGSSFAPLGCSFTAFPGYSGVTVAADSFGF